MQPLGCDGSVDIAGLATMIDSMVGGAPHQIAVVSYSDNPTLLGNFSSDIAGTADALAQFTPCDDSAAATFDAVAYATKLLEARDDHNARLRFRESYFSGALDTVPAEAQ